MTKTEQIASLYTRHVLPTYAPPRLALVKGKGTRVWDAEGRVYLDFAAGIAVLSVGHCHPRVTAAIQAQSAALMHVSNLFFTEPQARLAERLSALSGFDGQCFFCNSGAEANEALFKLARLHGRARGRFEILSMTNSFHGRTLATLAATGQTKYQEGFEPLPAGFRQAPFNDLAAVRTAVSDKTAAILVEAVQGEGGVVPADPAFLQGIRALCDDQDLLMLCDEVQCGLGRTGHWFGFQAASVTPDAFSLAKALGGGLPIGAIVAGPRAASLFSPGRHASTFGGNPVAAAAALAMLETVEAEGLLERAASAGARFRQGLEALVGGPYTHVTGVRGTGLMLGLTLDTDPRPLLDRCLEKGLIALPAGGSVVRFVPPLTVKDSELEEALEIVEEAVAEWHGLARAEDEEA